MNQLEELNSLLNDLESRQGYARSVRQYMTGRQPKSMLSKESRTALKGGLDRLGVNFPALVVQSKADRMRVIGVSRDGTENGDPALWARWKAAGLVEKSEHIIADRLAYGVSYATVWGNGPDGRRPVVTTDTPQTMVTRSDPLTGEVVTAVRRWEQNNTSHALVLDSERATYWTAPNTGAVAGSGWRREWSREHGLRSCPVVAFPRRLSSDDWAGTSAIADIADLTDLNNKLMADMAVTSEFFARPRRWATGLEIVENEDGEAVDPFGDDRFLQSESPETKFGQLPPAGLESYAGPIATVTQMIGALTGLPPHYLGLHGDQPANADSVKAAEAQLTSAAYSEMRGMEDDFSRLLELMNRVAEGTITDAPQWRALWDSPEIRTPAQAADAAGKLASIGVPLEVLLTDVLKWTPERAQAATRGARDAAVMQALQHRATAI